MESYVGTWLLTTYVTLAKLLPLFGPQFVHL